MGYTLQSHGMRGINEAKMQFTFFNNMTMQRFNELTEHMI
jgi:hypothetical protein